MSILEEQLDQGLHKVSSISPDEYYKADNFRNITLEYLLKQYSNYPEKMSLKDVQNMVTDFQRDFIQSGAIGKAYGITGRGDMVENAVREYFQHLRQKSPINEEIKEQLLQKCLDFSKYVLYDKPLAKDITDKAHNLGPGDFKLKPKPQVVEEPKKLNVVAELEKEKKRAIHSRSFRDYLGPEGTKNLDDLVKECPYDACSGEKDIIGCEKFMLERLLKGISDNVLLDRIAFIAVRMKNKYISDMEKRKDLEKKNKLQKSTIPITHSKNILTDLYSALGMRSIPRERLYSDMKAKTKYDEVISKITDSIMPHYDRCKNIDPMKDDYIISGEIKDALRNSSRNYDDVTGTMVTIIPESLPPVESLSLKDAKIESPTPKGAVNSNVLQFPGMRTFPAPKKIMIRSAQKKETAVLQKLYDASDNIEGRLNDLVYNTPKSDAKDANVTYYLRLFSVREDIKNLRKEIDSTLYHYDNYLKVTEKEQIDLKEGLRTKYGSLKNYMDIALKYIDLPFKNLKEMNVDINDFRPVMGEYYKKLEDSVEFLNWTALMISSSDFLHNNLRVTNSSQRKTKYVSMGEIRAELSDVINDCKRVYKDEAAQPSDVKPKNENERLFDKAMVEYNTLSKSVEAEPVKMKRPQVTVASHAGSFDSLGLFNQYILATKTESEGMYHEDVKKADKKIYNSYFAKLDSIDPGLKRVIDLSPNKRWAYKRVAEVFQLRKDIFKYIESAKKIHGTLSIFDTSDLGSRKGSEYHNKKIDFTNMVIYETTMLDRLLRRKKALGDISQDDLRLDSQNILNNYHACYHKVRSMEKIGIGHDAKPGEIYAHDEYLKYMSVTNLYLSNNHAKKAA